MTVICISTTSAAPAAAATVRPVGRSLQPIATDNRTGSLARPARHKQPDVAPIAAVVAAASPVHTRSTNGHAQERHSGGATRALGVPSGLEDVLAIQSVRLRAAIRTSASAVVDRLGGLVDLGTQLFT